MQKMAEDGMTHGAIHAFTMDNIDWKKNTLGGGSFNATTAITVNERGGCDALCPIFWKSTLGDVPNTEFPVCYISAKDRQKSRSLSSIIDVEDLARVYLITLPK